MTGRTDRPARFNRLILAAPPGLPAGDVEMAKLTSEQRDDRLRFDYQVASQMQSPIMNVMAYRSIEDLRAQRNPITAVAEGHLAKHYLAHYNVKTLIGPDRHSSSTSVHFDLLAGGNYPLSEPKCWVISDKLPWTPHFNTNHPICIGEMWEASRGRMLFGQLLIHVAKLLNFDEIPRSATYGGYTPEAAAYWRTKLNMQPITPDLVYPVLPDWTASKPITVQDLVKPVASSPVFQAKPQTQPPANAFRPKSVSDEQQQVMFAPSPRNRS